MAAAEYDITIEQGATLSLIFDWKDAAGAAVPLAGVYTAKMQVRTKHSEDAQTLMLTASSPIEIAIEPGAVAGRIQITVKADKTALVARDGVYDLELTKIADPTDVTRLVRGKALLVKQVTR